MTNTLASWVLDPVEIEKQLEQLCGKCLDDEADRHDVAIFIVDMIQSAITYRESTPIKQPKVTL